jgi:hypothetical protein
MAVIPFEPVITTSSTTSILFVTAPADVEACSLKTPVPFLSFTAGFGFPPSIEGDGFYRGIF